MSEKSLTIDSHSAQALDIDEFLRLLAGYCNSTITGEWVRHEFLNGLYPPQELRQLVADCLKLDRLGVVLPQVQFADPEPALAIATTPGKILDRQEFQDLHTILASIREIGRIFAWPEEQEAAPAFYAWFQTKPCLSETEKAFRHVFDEDWEIRNDASPKLAEVRYEIKTLRARINAFYHNIIHDPDYAGIIQEPVIVIRNRRYTIPIVRERKNHFPGIIHDQSNSGKTVFIEHSAMVEHGNRLAECELEERDEIIRILTSLTAEVRRHAAELRELFKAIRLYDFLRAVVRFAGDYDCHLIAEGEQLRLKQARHILLQHRLRTRQQEAELVPLDLEPDPAVHVILISGANAGGKTITLKTAGLIAVLHAYGLPVPCAPESRIPRYQVIFSDIGDDQSLSQDLSTFSAHLQNLQRAVTLAGSAHALILLDELGTATDPAEGAALAGAVLKHLNRCPGLTLATSHLPQLKLLARQLPGMLNASVLFDTTCLKPLYRLVLGSPGASYAMAIAKRIGFPQEILQDAETLLDQPMMKVEHMLAELTELRQNLEKDRERLRQQQARLRAQRDELRREQQELREKRRGIIARAQQEAEGIVRNTRRQMEDLLKQAREKSSSSPSRQELRELYRQVTGEEDKRQRHKVRSQRSRPKLQRVDPGRLKAGDTVFVETLQEHVTVRSIESGGRRLSVEHNGLTFLVDAKKCFVPQNKPDSQKKDAQVHLHIKRSDERVPPELKLIGKRVEEARHELEQYLDRAALCGLFQVRIIHGLGTGALQQAVHEVLKKHPAIQEFHTGMPDRDEGGAGVTWVTLQNHHEQSNQTRHHE